MCLIVIAGRYRGGILPEALVTVFLLSAGMHTNAQLLNSAVTMLNDNSNHQRALRLNSSLAATLRNIPTAMVTASLVPGSQNCLDSADCQPAELVAAAIGRWQYQIENQLPSGHGEIFTHTDGNTLVLELRVRWLQPLRNNTDELSGESTQHTYLNTH